MVNAHVNLIEYLWLLITHKLPAAINTILVLCTFVIQKPSEHFFLQRQLGLRLCGAHWRYGAWPTHIGVVDFSRIAEVYTIYWVIISTPNHFDRADVLLVLFEWIYLFHWILETSVSIIRDKPFLRRNLALNVLLLLGLVEHKLTLRLRLCIWMYWHSFWCIFTVFWIDFDCIFTFTVFHFSGLVFGWVTTSGPSPWHLSP